MKNLHNNMDQPSPKSQKKLTLFGRKVVLEALEAGKTVEKAFIQKGIQSHAINSIKTHLKEMGVPFQQVPVEKLNRLTGGNHQGVVAYLSPIRYFELADIIAFAFEKGEVPLIVLLDGITDVRNLGAIARSASLAGAHAMVVPAKGSAMINAEAVKASAGALNTLHVCRSETIIEAVELLQLNGLVVLGAEGRADRFVWAADLSLPLGIVMGSEDKGISPEVRDKVNEMVRIPMAGEMDSFNVSVAAGIILYEVMRQRM